MLFILGILLIGGVRPIRAQQPCFEHLERVPRLLGAYKPQCNEMGFYQSKQCHGSTGYCWCTTPHGIKTGQSARPGRRLSC